MAGLMVGSHLILNLQGHGTKKTTELYYPPVGPDIHLQILHAGG